MRALRNLALPLGSCARISPALDRWWYFDRPVAGTCELLSADAGFTADKAKRLARLRELSEAK